MSTFLDVISGIALLGGALLALTASIALVRFPDTMSRMHAGAKPQVLGLLLVLAGATIRLRGNVDVGMLVLAGMFQLITASVVAHRLSRAAYRERDRCVRADLLVADELAEDEGTGEAMCECEVPPPVAQPRPEPAVREEPVHAQSPNGAGRG